MSFVSPLFLIGLAAAALPVLYHLVRRMRAKQVPFSSLMLLKATPKEYVRRRRLRDLLLMAVRAALFAALALAFARPFIPQERLPFIAEREDRSVVLLLDASYSMQYADRFEEAKAAALERLNEAEGADEFAVIAFSNRPQQLTAFDAEGATHQSVVAGLDVTNRTTDVHAALQRAEEVLGEARHADRRIVLVSDFQQAGWSGPFENWKLAPGIAFEPVEVGGEAAGNAYVEAFNLTKRRTGAQTAVRFDARVAAQGEAAEAQRDVRLVVDGAEVDAQTVVPEASGRVSFELLAPREDAIYGGTLALAEADALPVDDRFYFAYEVAPRPEMLVLDGGRGARRDAFFLQSAFATGDDARYAFRAAAPDRLQSELQGQDVVFLTNAAGLTGAQTEAARRYVEEGGSVVVSFGERVDLGAFSGLLAALGVGAVERVVTPRLDQGADAIIGEVDGRHPVFNAFAGAGAGAIFRPAFRRYARLRPDSAATVLGRYDTGDPFLVERRLGRGHVLAYTSTFNTDWTDFPIDESYVPFVYGLAAYATRRSETRRQFTVGEAVPIEGRPGEAVDVRAPGDRLFKVTLGEDGTGLFQETEAPGPYVAATSGGPFAFAVNVDRAESDLTARDAAEAYAAVVAPADSARTSALDGGATDVADEEARQKLWRYLVMLVIALFVLETILANRRSGRRRAQAQPPPVRPADRRRAA